MPENTPKKVLIVEDDKFLSKMLSRMLESKHLTSSLAATGQEGINKATSEKPDLILLDIMLPDTDGFAVLKKIKESTETQKIPVIIMSNLGQPEDVAQGKSLGAVDHLVKSDLSLDEVVEKVNEKIK